ncbi:MAG: hypothetical protein WCJ18_10660, partial [Planctomycetota bacterium]
MVTWIAAHRTHSLAACVALGIACSTAATAAPAAPAAPQPAATAAPKPPVAKKPVLVPGTGSVAKGATDTFEDEKWSWSYNHPKSSEEQDKRMRGPMGKSANRLWFEGPKRGTPDVVKRIPLPSPGLEGSTHGMLIASLRTGIPGKITYDMQQDELMFAASRSLGRGIAVADSPSIVTRV